MVTATQLADGAKRKIRTGIALSATELCATDIRLRGVSDRAWRATLEPPPTDSTAWPSLAAAFRDLAKSLDVTEGRFAVSLLPPLTEVRRLELPPATADDTNRLLARNASRYFVNARGAQIVGALAGRKTRGSPTPTVAAAASARLVAAIRSAAAQSGWTIDVIAPAESAWAAAAVALWPAFVRQNAWAIVAHDDRTDLLEIDNGRLAGVRRFRAGGADAALIADTLGPSARVGIAGVQGQRRELSNDLLGLGLKVVTPVGEWATVSDRADLLAAHFAGSEGGLVLRAADAVVLERVRSRKAAWMTAVAAGALLLVAALVELWGVHRQLALVKAERARLRPQIASTMVGRTTVEATYRHLMALNGIERAAPHWSAVIATLTDAVPEDAYLTAIRARDDSLIIDGLAQHAARVFDSLEKTNMLADVKAVDRVRRELQDDGKSVDHFSIAARVVSATKPGAGAARLRSVEPAAREASGMNWSSMSDKDKRALRFGAIVLLAAGLAMTVRPYMAALSDARDRLATESATLAREQAAVSTARQNPQLQHVADSAMRTMRPRLFEGKDDVMASAELASYVGDVARRARVWLQDANTRPATPVAEGLRTLRVEIRAESDLHGTLLFLQALERGDKLVRVDRLDISRAPRSDVKDSETLSIAATISGFAVNDSVTAKPASSRPTVAALPSPRSVAP